MWLALECADIFSLTDRIHLEASSHTGLKTILEYASCLHSLLPDQRDPSVTCRLKRVANNSPRFHNRTKTIRPSYHNALQIKLSVYHPILIHNLYDIVLLFRPGGGAEYCDQPVCLCVCLFVSEHIISGTTGPIGLKFCVRIPCGRRSVFLRWHCATLCTSGFVDDVTFGRNGRDAERWRLTRAATAMNDVAIPGQSLMSMNACCVLCIVFTCIVFYV